MTTDAAADRRTLTLHIEEPRQGDYLLVSQARVRYLIHSHSPEGLREDDLPPFDTWGEVRSTLDNHALMAFVNGLQEARVGEDSIFAATVERGVSLWQFIICHLQPAIMRVLGLVETLKPLITDTRPDVIAVIPAVDAANHLWRRTVAQVASALGVPTWIVPIRIARRHTDFADYPNHSRPERILSTIGGWSVRAASRLLSHFSAANQIPSSSGKRLLFATSARHWVRLPGSPEFYDEQFSPLLPALRAAGWTKFVGLDCSHPPTPHTLHTLWERMRDPTTADVRWRAAVLYGYSRQPDKAAARLNRERMWHRISTSPTFQSRLCFEGVSLLPVLADDFRDAIENWLPTVTDTLLAAERIILAEQPDAIMASSEAVGLWERAVVIQARRHGLPTVGLQHGMIFNNHYHYMHRSITTENADRHHGFQRPDVTCVWGPAWKEVLTVSGHYPPSSVRVTGNWRYDTLSRLPDRRLASEMRRHLRIGNHTRIVLIVSGNHNVGHFVQRCLRHLEHRPDCIALVKPHPSDDIAPIREVLRNRRYKGIAQLCTQLLEGLLSADLVISQVSTVVCEAAFWGRPVILVDFEGVVGWDAYMKAGMCIQVTDEAELKPVIDGVLSGELPDGEMWRAQREFSARHFLQPDGFAARRVVELLAGARQCGTAI